GIGIAVDGHAGVTIRNAKLRGFRVGVQAIGSPRLRVEGCDVGGMRRMRLRSTPEREDESDWLWPHRNDDGEWAARYGAGIWAKECDGSWFVGNRARASQNGLLLDRSNACRVHDNDLSFLSGWGLAMWRASRNEIAHNRFDWCVRGYSHGVYDRGQDSAGILVFEQCDENVFAFNSATHGGDGFFLYAGNETVERTGKGGCNGNRLYGNDFSHAVANGIEATFSIGNVFAENRLDDCSQHGVWGGFSSETRIVGNQIRGARGGGVSIEHGHDNAIEGNLFERCRAGVELWENEKNAFAEKPYGRNRETRSMRTSITGNRFVANGVAIDLKRSAEITVRGNAFLENERDVRTSGDCPKLEVEKAGPDAPLRSSGIAAPKVGGTLDAMLPASHPRGREWILIDEWGPYDFSAPRLQVSSSGPHATIRVLGPSGRYRVADPPAGFSVEPREDVVPGSVRVELAGEGSRLAAFEIPVDVGGQSLVARGSLVRASWDVRWFGWQPGADPRKGPPDWNAVTASEPLARRTVDALAFRWGADAPADGVARDFFATVAETRIDLAAGRYEIRTVSDDGVRVLVDGRVVQEDWTWHPPKENVSLVELAAGSHAIRVEHFEIDGAAELRATLAPAPSAGR
ncbi:MAG TPA: right-handed parallel beta-helix repeat-containing protein, partial [Planctomycetota bacterium]|nr:right-handed parallel beta-helix repeat-containing protein [Planctomycetota bacterium]